jgi:hypothetical protein
MVWRAIEFILTDGVHILTVRLSVAVAVAKGLFAFVIVITGLYKPAAASASAKTEIFG